MRRRTITRYAARISSRRRSDRLGPSRWTDICKPIIAAVNGVACAGGLEWACYADIRIAEAHASFGVTCRRWNIGLADGGTQRLPRIVGMGRAMDEGLRIEAECFHRSFFHPDTVEGLRRFRERDHPDRRKDGPAKTPGIVRS